MKIIIGGLLLLNLAIAWTILSSVFIHFGLGLTGEDAQLVAFFLGLPGGMLSMIATIFLVEKYT